MNYGESSIGRSVDDTLWLCRLMCIRCEQGHDSSFMKLQVGKGGLPPLALNATRSERGQAALPTLQIDLT